MSLGFWQIALIVLLFLLLFGRGRIPQLMGDLAEGIKSFRSGFGDDDADKDGRHTGAPGQGGTTALPDSTGASTQEPTSEAVDTDPNATRRGAAMEE